MVGGGGRGGLGGVGGEGLHEGSGAVGDGGLGSRTVGCGEAARRLIPC